MRRKATGTRNSGGNFKGERNITLIVILNLCCELLTILPAGDANTRMMYTFPPKCLS